VPILLQKSFSTADQGLGAILIGEHSSASFLSKKIVAGILVLLQQYRHIAGKK
jgi:hypothetical protein